MDIATEWAAPSSKPHEALLMMALYETHTIAEEWCHHNPQALAQNAVPGGAPVAALQQ